MPLPPLILCYLIMLLICETADGTTAHHAVLRRQLATDELPPESPAMLVSSRGITTDCLFDVQMPANRWNFYFILFSTSLVSPHPHPPLQPQPAGSPPPLPSGPTAAAVIKFANPSLQRLLPAISRYLAKLFSSSLASPLLLASPITNHQPPQVIAPGECVLATDSAAFEVGDGLASLSALRFGCDEGPISGSVKSKLTDKYEIRCAEGRLVVGGKAEAKTTQGLAYCADKQSGQISNVDITGTQLHVGSSTSSETTSENPLLYSYHLSPTIDFYFTLVPHELLPAVKCGRFLYDPYWIDSQPKDVPLLPRSYSQLPTCRVEWPAVVDSELKDSCNHLAAVGGDRPLWCGVVERQLCDELVGRLGQKLHVRPPNHCGPVVNSFADFECE
eukprot:GHVS01065606.1.p1 GENE.GHVS01065606.1~~GHVS01065606.1.p1  ORF type:complete len:389 (+),score=76.56 GHVS01065606.1:186-1352(+)